LRKVFSFLILFSWQTHALEVKSTLKIYHDIFTSLTHKERFSVYTESKIYKNVFSKSKRIILSRTPSSADIILITKKDTLRKLLKYTKKSILFTTKYNLLDNSDDIIGAFYWRKGRSQLLFIKNRLKKHGISLPGKYSKYIIDTL